MSDNVLNQANRFRLKALHDEATKLQLAILATFENGQQSFPDNPLWPIVVRIQREYTNEVYREQHADYNPVVTYNEDSVAVVWSSMVDESEGRMFLSVQATSREVPTLHHPAPPEALNEVLMMIQDINSNDTGAAMIMATTAINSFIEAGLVITALDADPETNLYLIQAYTPDRKYLLDIQLDYATIQEDIEFQEKEKEKELVDE